MWQMLISPITNLIDGVLDKIVPDAAERDRLKHEISTQLISLEDKQLGREFQLLIEQIAVNKIEAQSESLFKSGWRPFVGWTCASALAYAAIFEPMGQFIASVVFGYEGAFPVIDTTITMQVLLGLLGLAGMRSYEKKQGVNKG